MGVRTTKLQKSVMAKGLPVPRLQFVWEQKERPGDRSFNWFCHYELVLGLRENDLRNPFEFKKPGEICMRLGGTWVGSNGIPLCGDEVDTPFRDGAHSIWDSQQLGWIPILAIYNDNITELVIDKTKGQVIDRRKFVKAAA